MKRLQKYIFGALHVRESMLKVEIQEDKGNIVLEKNHKQSNNQRKVRMSDPKEPNCALWNVRH